MFIKTNYHYMLLGDENDARFASEWEDLLAMIHCEVGPRGVPTYLEE